MGSQMGSPGLCGQVSFSVLFISHINMFSQVAVQSRSAAVSVAWFMHGSLDVAEKKSWSISDRTMSVVACGDTRCLHSLHPHFHLFQVSMVVLGTFMLWFGWIGFNGGCAFGANLRAIMAIWNTMIAAAFGGMAWCLFDYRIGHKFSMVSFCSGTIAGLVLATSASGYVSAWAALIMGVTAGILCNIATKRELNLSKILAS